MKKITFCCLLLFITSLKMFSHEETPLKTDSIGTLIGLPKEFGSAHFDKENFIIRVGNKIVTLPDCIKSQFDSYPHYEITFSASWYHETELLPYYIKIQMISTKEEYGFEISFNLETLQFIEVSKGKVIRTKNNTILYRPTKIEIPIKCLEQINTSIKTIKN